MMVPSVRRLVEDRDECLRHAERLVRERDKVMSENAALRAQLAQQVSAAQQATPAKPVETGPTPADFKARLYDPARIPGLKTD